MADPHHTPTDGSRLPDPEVTSAPDPQEGVSQRKFLGIPAWATAVLFAALAAIMYLVMFALGG